MAAEPEDVVIAQLHEEITQLRQLLKEAVDLADDIIHLALPRIGGDYLYMLKQKAKAFLSHPEIKKLTEE